MHLNKYLVSSWWPVWDGLEGVALLEEGCHWEGAWRFQKPKQDSVFLPLSPSPNQTDSVCLCLCLCLSRARARVRSLVEEDDVFNHFASTMLFSSAAVLPVVW